MDLLLLFTIDTKKLLPNQKKYAQLSIDRIEHPEKYGNSIGIMVAKLTRGGNFEKFGLVIGDVIIALNGDVINEPLDLASALAKNDENPILLSIIRNNQNVII